MAAGSTQILAFDLGGGDNTAVHGGGSCQLSITYETDPAKQKDPSSWKVIYSIEGGCPTDAAGNLQDGQVVDCPANSTDTACVNVFPFVIPKGVKDGHAIMAWTWFNTIGNREIYMNCMNVNFTGGDGSEVKSFPELFVANQAGIGTCPTTEEFNVKFPDPGKYVTTKTEGNPYPLAVPTGDGCSSAGAVTAASASVTSPVTYGQLSTTSQDYTITSMTTVTLLMSSPCATSSSSTPATQSSAVTPSPTATSSACLNGYVQCSAPGELVCIGATHFGICDMNKCAVSQDVAPGTMCSNGKIVQREKSRRGLLPVLDITWN